MLLYNSLINKKQEFKSLSKNKVLMYVCGITPYDTTHLGHAFTYLQFDVLKRFLEFKGFNVIYTQNITDVDDDILRKAREEKRNWKKLGEYWTNIFLKDMDYLNIKRPTFYIKATEAIDEIKAIIAYLLEKGFAYIQGENVYFEVKRFKAYGKLSKLSKTKMIAISKERGANPGDPNKKDPLDFILWQKSKDKEPSWNSDWGQGRPGWHIVCSAMIYQTLGDQTDIHGGGVDLIYPHHESEIAQTVSYTKKKPFVKNWMHTAMVSYKGDKMSKSLGNLVLVSDLAKKFSGNEIRFCLLEHHYRDPWEFKDEDMDSCHKCLEEIEKLVGKKVSVNFKTHPDFENFTRAMEDDLDTPKALKIMVNLSKKVKVDNDLIALKKMFEILGFKA